MKGANKSGSEEATAAAAFELDCSMNCASSNGEPMEEVEAEAEEMIFSNGSNHDEASEAEELFDGISAGLMSCCCCCCMSIMEPFAGWSIQLLKLCSCCDSSVFTTGAKFWLLAIIESIMRCGVGSWLDQEWVYRYIDVM